MSRMSGFHAPYASPILGPSQPTRKLGPNTPSQDATALLPQPLAGHDQDDSQVERRRLLEEARHGTFGHRQGHAVQIQRRLGRATAA